MECAACRHPRNPKESPHVSLKAVGFTMEIIQECAEILKKSIDHNYHLNNERQCVLAWEKLKYAVPLEVMQWKKNNNCGPDQLNKVQLVRDALESACLLQVHLQNLREFEICWYLLEPLYIVYANSQISSSHVRPALYAIELLKLLVDGERAGDFHVLLQRLSCKDLENPDIIFVTKLKEFLMSGNYKKSLEMISKPPNPRLRFLCHLLIGSIRRSIADCLTNSLVEISCDKAKQLLNLESDEELNIFVDETNHRYEALKSESQFINSPATGFINVSLEEKSHFNQGYKWERSGDKIYFVALENQINKSIPVEEVESYILGNKINHFLTSDDKLMRIQAT